MDNPRFEELKALAKQCGLDFFDLAFEVVPEDIMAEVAAYGLPTRARHWSYGKTYKRQRVHGKMGLSHIYEIVLNNDPAYAFLLDTNTEITNLLVVAHVYAHSDFFKRNIYFSATNRNMINKAVEHALRIDEYIERYGIDRVEHVMDIAFAVDRHIDPHKGLLRKRYPERQVIERERKSRDAYGDLFGDKDLSIEKVVIGDRLPPHPEKDLLWFFMEYAPVTFEPWERNVFAILREESYYFYPQFETKVMNEGWASYWHAEILNRYDGLTPQETIDFGALHAGVLNPGHRMNLNPYYLGYQIFVDIEKRWDKLHAKGESPITGREKLFQVREEENDITFLGNYLTQELVDKLELFSYGWACEHGPANPKKCEKCGDIVIKSRKVEEVVESLLEHRYHYGAPPIVIDAVEADGTLVLRHDFHDVSTLDPKYAEETLKFLSEVWKKPVRLRTFREESGNRKRVYMLYREGNLNIFDDTDA